MYAPFDIVLLFDLFMTISLWVVSVYMIKMLIYAAVLIMFTNVVDEPVIHFDTDYDNEFANNPQKDIA